MRKRIGYGFTAAVIAAVLCLTSCGQSAGYREIRPGDGLPTWKCEDTLYSAALPSNAKETMLSEVYRTDREDVADVYLYRYDREAGVSLEEFGQRQADEHKVFCNMTEYEGVPAANIVYRDTVEGKNCIVRAYLFEQESGFVKLCSVHKTQAVPLGTSGKTISMIAGYTKTENEESAFPYEAVYRYADQNLPTVRVRQFAKDHFTAETYRAALTPETDKKQYEAYAADGWTVDEFLALYRENYDLKKGEHITRNGLDIGFVGYIDHGVFYVRALIDCGSEYVMLCAENDAASFQHVTNALIDTII